MKPVLIVENSINALVKENKSNNDYILSGVFTEFDVMNRNERIYTSDKFIPCLEELNSRISSLGVVYGEFDHPDVFDTSLSRASHTIRSASFIKEHNRVDGEIRLLSTYWGKEAKSLVNDGCPLFVSSRAAGVTEANGIVSLKKLFTYDLVADPGFASAKMNVKSLNESLKLPVNANYRIYEMSDESKINELINMNTNDVVTKKQLTDYSKYLINELASTKKEVKNALSKGNLNPKKLEQLLEYYEELNKTNSNMVKYLDYIAEKVQVVVDENTTLKNTTNKLIKHNDYLAENLEKAITYSEYLAENLDKNIAYSEYIVENLDKNITYSEYLAENLDKNITYSEYLAENLDKNIEYAEYIAENLDKNISYSEYIAENVDNSIKYSEYLAEHVEGNIAYSEYIAENLDDNIAYSEYVAENLDKSISYQGLIVEKLRGSKINENLGMEEEFPTLAEHGFEEEEEDEMKDWNDDEDIIGDMPEDDALNNADSMDNMDNMDNLPTDMNDNMDDENDDITDDENDVISNDNAMDEDEFEREEEIGAERFEGNSDTELSKSIDKLIEEAKKRKANESVDLHFLKFLNKSQVDSFYSLTIEDQDTVKLYINEKSFFTSNDVLRLISEALSTKNETLEDRVIKWMPENVKPIWNQLNENARKSLLSQARLYPDDVMKTESQVEHFWLTRNLKKNESVTKKLVSHESLIQEDKLSDKELKSIMERFRNI